MGVMKRIYTERGWNETLAGAAMSPEIAAMKRLVKRCDLDRKRPRRKQAKQGRLFE